MARTVKTGFDYFPLDTDFFSSASDRRIRRLLNRYGADGPILYLYTLCQVYGGEEYYVVADDEWIEDAADALHTTDEKIGLMLHYMASVSLFDNTLLDTVKVLTSHGIQTQFQKIVKTRKREIEVDGGLWLLEEAETESFVKVRSCENKSGINGNKSGINGNKSGINPTKEKVKEKEKEKVKGNMDKPLQKAFVPPSREEVIEYCKSRNSSVDPNRFYDFFSAGEWVDSKGNKVKNWKQKLITWESNSGVITKSQSRQPNWDMNYEEACQRDDRDLLEKLLGVAKEESNE